MPPRRSLLRRRRRGCQRPAAAQFRARAGSLGRRWTHLHVWSRFGRSAGVYRPSVPRRDLAAPAAMAKRRRHMIGPPHRAAFRPTHQRRLTHKSPTDPPRPQPPPSRGPAAGRALPETQSRKGTRPTRTRQPPSRATQSARVDESPREVVGPTGRRRRRRAARRRPPTKTCPAPNSRLATSTWASR